MKTPVCILVSGAWHYCLVGIALMIGWTASLSAAAPPHWPQFRGPGALGLGHGKHLPEVWDSTTNVAWKTEIPGLGWSSPIVWGDRIFVTTVVSDGEIEPPKKGLYFGGNRLEISPHTHHWRVYCVDAQSGAIRWSKEVHTGRPESPKHVKNSYASETPVTDGKHVYAYFGNVGLFCLDFAGREVWSKRWDRVEIRYGWGTSSSPALHQNRIYVVNDNEDQSFLVALDKNTGKQIWRVERDEPSNFSTPYIWENQRRTELVTTGVNKTRSYDLEGQPLWEFKGMSSIVIPTPFARQELLYVCAGYVGDNLKPNKPVYAIRPGASGDITLDAGKPSSPYIAWRQINSAPYNPSPIVYRERFYVLWDFGFLSCRNALTGEEIYDKQRLNPSGPAAFTSSLWAYNGQIFCLSEDGDTYVVEAGDKFNVLRKNSLGEMALATPAITPDALIIRTASHLFKIQEPAP